MSRTIMASVQSSGFTSGFYLRILPQEQRHNYSVTHIFSLTNYTKMILLVMCAYTDFTFPFCHFNVHKETYSFILNYIMFPTRILKITSASLRLANRLLANSCDQSENRIWSTTTNHSTGGGIFVGFFRNCGRDVSR